MIQLDKQSVLSRCYLDREYKEYLDSEYINREYKEANYNCPQ